MPMDMDMEMERDKRNSLLKELLRLTVLQKQALKEKNMERLCELLDDKQAVIEQVDLLGVPAGPEQVTRRHLEQIQALDTEINELMKQNLGEIIQSINQLQAARRTETAYRNNTGTAHSYFINKQR